MHSEHFSFELPFKASASYYISVLLTCIHQSLYYMKWRNYLSMKMVCDLHNVQLQSSENALSALV